MLCCAVFVLVSEQDVKQQSDAELLVLPTDAVVFTDDGFR